MRSAQGSVLLTTLALAAGAILSACSGGGGGGAGFRISAINLNNGAVWRINRPIKVTFTEAVDFASVNLNTFNVRQVGGGPAAGEFYLEDAGRTVVFQPLCPRADDLSDAGLKAGTNPLNNDLPYAYELNIIGVDQNSLLPVRSVSGEALELSQTRLFTTPVSLNPLDLYLDTKVGPPVARVIGDQPDTDTTNGTHIEIGGPNGQKHYFERDSLGMLVMNPPIDLPLNKLSEPQSQVALVVGFDQSVNPSSANINSSRIRWEFQNFQGAWQPLTTTVTLINNCTRTGAIVRVEPDGLLPPSTNLRAVLTPEFLDIVGESNPVAQNNFAVASTEPFPTNPPQLVDHFLDDFDTNVNEDAAASFAEPHAEWGGGELKARFSFTGTGGPNGSFDWYIPQGAVVIFNTANSTINGYALTFTANSDNITSAQPTGNQTVVGGVVDVDDFYVDTGATLKIEGPNAFVLMAAGRVVIRGKVDISGTSSNGVNTLNTTSIPEPGAPGQAGGGKGGTGSPLTTASSPRGGNGFGAWNVADLGGQGGETGWSPNAGNQNLRRGGGGGGGVLGPNVLSATQAGPCAPMCMEQRRIGYDAEKGFDALQATNGAFSGAAGPFGGAVAPSPFSDPDPNNNFYGTQFDRVNDVLIAGELLRPWAGAGGGGGGDASITSNFPGPWSPTGDEKGSGGAGGGGSCHVLALQHIAFGDLGQIICRGGIGGGGENTIFLNRVGGGSGGGSGGHVVLQSAQRIDFSLKVGVNFSSPNDNSFAIDTRGGEGGAGADDFGGGQQSLNGQREQLPNQDACPPGYPTTGTLACKGQVDGAGGDGSPGIIQLHTSTGLFGTFGSGADILLPAGVTVEQICAPRPLCYDNTPSVATCQMIPTFGRKSRARSQWVALGEGGFDPSSPTYKDVTFAFSGIDPGTGFVQTDPQDKVIGLPPILGPTALDLGGAAPPFIVTPGGAQLVMDATPLIGTPNEALLRNTALLFHYLIELDNGATFQRFDVVAASFTPANNRLTLTVDGDGPSLLSFNVIPGTTAELQPAFFRVRSSGTEDFLPDSATVQIELEATSADPITGLPDTTPGAVIGPTSNVNVLNAPPNGDLRFIRFTVVFDIAAQGQSLSANSPIPALEFFRLPFSYQ